MKSPQILIINLGSQYTSLIERTLRELGVRSVILPPVKARNWLVAQRPKAIILSGGEASVNDIDAPIPPEEVLTLGVPLLGICYGMQWLAKSSGGVVQSVLRDKHYGSTTVRLLVMNSLFTGLAPIEKVHASHGDSVVKLPASFREIAWATDGGLMGMCSESKKLWGVQFHPEVSDTLRGKDILRNFLEIAQCEIDWTPTDIIGEIRAEVLETAGDRKVIVGFSGGVDSTTCSAILSPVLGDRLLGVVIDGGQLREGELDEIREHAHVAGIDCKVIQGARDRFLPVFSDTKDAEVKRKRFKTIYQTLFVEEARAFGAEYILQGSLAPDLIESGATGAAVIKSHHNVGLAFGGLKQLHPFKGLFKYEVRALAEALGLPKSVSERQPFPGPGLFVRVVGEPVTEERLSIVRFADAETQRILEESGDYQRMSQLVVALLCVNTVGVKGDARVYGHTIAVRGLVTSDFMTGRGYQIAPDVRREITRTLQKHPGIVRVAYFEGDKPPETTEFE